MKIVVIGNGKVGENISSSLVQEGHDVTVIDRSKASLAKIQDTLDVMCVEGNGAFANIQREASVPDADIVIAVTPNDELNVLCCLVAKRLGADQTIARVRLPEYHRQMHLIREELGMAMIINPDMSAAEEIARVLTFPPAAKVDVFGKGKLELVAYRLPKDAPIINLTLSEAYQAIRTKFLICAVQRDGNVFIPDGNFILREGDRVHVAASHKNLEQFFRSCGVTKDREKIKSVIIVGGGYTACYLALHLLDIHAKVKIKIIEQDPNRSMQLAQLLPEVTVVCGDGADQEFLMEEGLMKADAFVALTGMDEENIVLSLFAKDVTDAKVVTKINRENYLNIVSRLDLDCVISPKHLTAGSVTSFVRAQENASGSEIESLYHIVGDLVEAVEFRVKESIPALTGIPLKDVRLKKNILICSVIRKRELIIPDGDTTIEVGDIIVAVSKDYHFSKLKDILR